MARHDREIEDNVWWYQAAGVCTNAYVVREIMREREPAPHSLASNQAFSLTRTKHEAGFLFLSCRLREGDSNVRYKG